MNLNSQKYGYTSYGKTIEDIFNEIVDYFGLNGENLNWDGIFPEGFIMPFCGNLQRLFDNPLDYFIGIWIPM